MEKISTTFLNYSTSDYTKPDKPLIADTDEQSMFPLFPQVEFLNYGNLFTALNNEPENEARTETENAKNKTQSDNNYEAKIFSINEEPYFKVGRMRRSL